MTETEENPELWVEQDGAILLRGVRCDQCGSVLFPPQHYGCEACGADETHLAEALISSDGKLRSFTTVFVHQKLETPYQVAEVETAARQLVRGRLVHPDPKLGDQVTGVVGISGETVDFVFKPQAEGGA
jgi:uncharacterized OB-fold protein